MDLDNANFRVICGRDIILGQRVADRPQKTQTPTTTAPPDKPQDSYTLAIMGATGAGKTVFLLSYLYATMQLGRGKHNVTVNLDAKEQKKLEEDIDNLINKGKSPISTSTYNNMSFNAGENMSVNLFDVPGGDTQGLTPEVTARLRAADGAIFFIDGEDLVHHPEKVLADNVAFGRASALKFSAFSLWANGYLLQRLQQEKTSTRLTLLRLWTRCL